jgi:hypothetical protein
LIANTIIWQAQDKLTSIDNPVGLTFQNNLWKVLPATAYRGPGDKIGDPKFASTPGYTPESYRPSSTSPAAAGAADIGITNDYFAKPRGPLFDMGGIQFSSSVSITQATASPLPTIQLTNTPVTTTSTAVPPTATAQPVSPTATSVPPTATLISPTKTATSVPTQPASTATAQPTQQSSLPSQEKTYDNTQSNFAYSSGWTEEIKSAAIGGSFARTSTNGSSVTFPFTGQSFSIIYKGGPSYRKMDVYVDGALVATIDERHDVSTYQVRWDYPGQFALGQHTLKLVFVTTSSSTNGSVDAVIVR